MVLKCGSNEPNIQIKLILSQKYCMKEIRVIGTFLGSGSLDPNIWVLLPFLDTNIGILLQWKYIKDVVIIWLAWQTWLTQLGKFNFQFTISILELLSKYQNKAGSEKRWFNTKFAHQILVLHIRVKRFEVQWLIQYFWCHFQVQTQIFGSNMILNPLIQLGPGPDCIKVFKSWC